ncbi:peptide/nickel transport system permease protein [Actinoplanes tereljensis]|uniref:Peptide ABC transporter permease n=1 Tax=Paractinoplanes tereljensis TaxID=571912 RepID=A0A919TVE6_9ACTN|nr:ABC transporter permease [Actinoplanes tereljensis]GIF23254.1 peptide ABC transporter permease [Actinoplanes tereljensis]
MRSRPYLRFVLVRLGALVLLAVGITLVSFILTNLVPGDPAAANLGQRALSDPAIVAAFRHQHGLDQPLPVQYWKYLTGLVQGDFGTSQRSNRPVGDELAEYVPATLELASTAVVLSVVVGVGLGMLAAMRRNSWLDQLLRVVSLAGVSMPTFWLALAAFFLLFYKWGILPGGGRLDPGLDPPPQVTGLYTVDALLAGQWDIFGNAVFHLIMPALVLAAYTVGLLTRFTRASMLEVLGNDYIRTAQAKGLPGRTIVFRHVLRPALVPILTVAGLAFGSLLSGTVLVEQIFSWNGIGQYAYQSALNLDLPAIMGVSLVVAVIYVTVNFVVDLLYGVVDPRVRLQ